MHKSIFYVFFILLFGAFSYGFAEYYQWTDKNGVNHFTDNILEVPENQRPGLKVHPGIKPIQEKKEFGQLIEVPSPQALLEAEKASLKQEYEELQEKRNALLARQKTMKASEYNDLVHQLNTEILAFEQKRLAFENRVGTVNAAPKPQDK